MSRGKIIKDKNGNIIKPGDPRWTKITEMRALRNAMNSISRVPAVLKQMNEFRVLYKRMKGNIPSHLKYSADPVQEILYPIIAEVSEESPEGRMIIPSHVRHVVRDGGEFALYMFSCDTAYRPIRNWVLHQLFKDDIIVKKMREALDHERSIENYLNPDEWYDNMKINAVNITKAKKAKGLIPLGSISSEESVFHDDMDFDKFKEKVKNKEV